MKLDKTEKNLVESLIVRFHKVWKNIEELETEITKITSVKETLLKELKTIRSEETNIISKLKEKYGEDHSLDLETFEIKETENKLFKKC